MLARTPLVNATDIDSWSRTSEARLILPILLRRLIRATSSGITELDFPSGESVDLPGWDGRLSVETGGEFVPNGVSGWELSTETDSKKKASEDYEKRTRDPLGLNPRASTFVFVTPRRWAGKQSWKVEKQRDKKWKAVRAYNASDLEAWLELAPAVHIWFSGLLGVRPDHVRDIDTFWTEWSESAVPAITPQLVLAGREKEQKAISNWLESTAGATTIKGDTKEEALAALVAAIKLFPDDAGALISQAVIVDDADAWSELVTQENRLLLIANFDIGTRYVPAVKKGHRVIVLLGRSDSDAGQGIVLPRLKRYEVAEELRRIDANRSDIDEAAKLARRSLLAYRRKVSTLRNVHQPDWAAHDEARSILPILLAGMWNETVAGDREAVSRLANADYEAVSTAIARWSNYDDPPVRQVGEHVLLTSKEDAWFLLDRYLTRTDLNILSEVAQDVLGEIDPKFELPAEDQWLAGVRGKTRKYSSLLRKGISETLAVIAVNAKSSQLPLNIDGQAYCNSIIRVLLDKADKDIRVWASLNDVLPILAEAGPDELLNSINSELATEEANIVGLFVSRADPLYGSASHTGLLWALERLAWSQEYLGYASLLLAKLSRLDPEPKSRYANRPAKSLHDIFLLWHPQTSASQDQRLKVLDNLSRQESTVSFDLLLGIIPRSYSAATSTSTPEWRDWLPDPAATLTWGDVWAASAIVVGRLGTLAGNSGSRWKELLGEMQHFPKELQQSIVDVLTACKPADFSDDDKALVADEIRSLLAHNRSYPDAAWAMPSELLNKLEGLQGTFEPEDLWKKYSWLFSSTPQISDRSTRDWGERDRVLTVLQDEALTMLSTSGSLEELIAFAKTVDRPDEVGRALGRSSASVDESAILVGGLASDDARLDGFARGFVVGRGRQWMDRLIESPVWDKLNFEQQANFLRLMSPDHQTWELVRTQHLDVQRLYWTKIDSFFRDDTKEAIEYLLEYGRPYVAINIAAYSRELEDDVDREAVYAKVLDAAMKVEDVEQHDLSMVGHNLGRMMDVLAQSGSRDENRLAAYEWYFMPLLEHYRAPITLHRKMATDPDFFVDLLKLVYKGRHQEKGEINSEDAARAHLAYELLFKWRYIPGLQSDGSIDAEQLNTWFSRARQLYVESDRKEVGDQTVAQTFSASREDSDGTWPPRPIRDLIENTISDDLEQGFTIGVFNSRGVTTRAPSEGGKQERELAKKYREYASAISHEWHRTAAALRRIAEGYEQEAKREDIDAELSEDVL